MSLHYFTMVRVLLHIGPNELHCEGGRGGKLNNAFSADAAGCRIPPTPPSYVKLTFTFDFLFSFFFRISCFLFRTAQWSILIQFLKFWVTSSNKNVIFLNKNSKMSTTFIEVFYCSIFSTETENKKCIFNIHRFIKKKNIYRVMDIVCSSYQWLHVSMLNILYSQKHRGKTVVVHFFFSFPNKLACSAKC